MAKVTILQIKLQNLSSPEIFELPKFQDMFYVSRLALYEWIKIMNLKNYYSNFYDDDFWGQQRSLFCCLQLMYIQKCQGYRPNMKKKIVFLKIAK